MSSNFSDADQFKVLATRHPVVDLVKNFKAARKGGRFLFPVLLEILALRMGPGKLSFHEYFYYRLWDPRMSMGEKRRFIGKNIQRSVHKASNLLTWYAVCADKLLFQTLGKGIGLPLPELIAITQARRIGAGVPSFGSAEDIAGFLRKPEHYPIFIKPIDGVFSLRVTSADSFDSATDELVLRNGRCSVAALSGELAAHPPGHLIQKRLSPHPQLAERFGPPLWSVRIFLLLNAEGPIAFNAVAKIATGKNPADNFWRAGNMLGAIDLATGTITRTVRGTGADMSVNEPHPDTGAPLVGTIIPDWPQFMNLMGAAALLVPGVRTQAWDVAITDKGPVILELNSGGDLNLIQLGHGKGVLTETYINHVRQFTSKIL